MRFGVLGALVLSTGERELTLSAPKLRSVLSLLLVNHNRVTQTISLIDELWDENPPISAVTTLQTYVYQLRKILGDAEPGAERMLTTRSTGYEARIPPEAIDLCWFENLVKQGTDALHEGDVTRASQVLREALELWRGPALIDVPRGRLLAAHAIKMEEIRLNALEMRIDADLQLRRHREVISELKSLIASNPLSEAFYSRLMRALYLSNRRDEALDAYRKLYRTLADELGLEPSRSLQQLHAALLTDDPVREDPSLAEPGEPPETVRLAAPSTLPPPAELPPDIGDFTGRHAEMSQILSDIETRDAGSAARIIEITGMPGVGKSVLATHLGHMVKDQFDGQLCISLNGSNMERSRPGDALTSVLRTVGFDETSIPCGVDERARLYRSWTANRKLLVVVDDAGGAAEVRPLLPTGPGSVVLITSRLPLCGLGARKIVRLDSLDLAEGSTLLARILGQERVVKEPQAAKDIVAMCGGLPLGIRIAGERLAIASQWSLARFAEQLTAEETRFAELSCGDLELRSSFHSTFLALEEELRRIFLLLSTCRQGITADMAADLAGIGAAEMEGLLFRMVDTGLVVATESEGGGPLVYSLPILTLLYGAEQVAAAQKDGLHFDLLTACSSVAGGDGDRPQRGVDV